MKLPPYGQQYLDRLPRAGVMVAIGPTAWNFAESDSRIIMALPYDEHPRDYRWPSHESGALIFERGQYDDDRLSAMARALLEAGSPFVLALREALKGKGQDCRAFFYPDIQYVGN